MRQTTMVFGTLIASVLLLGAGAPYEPPPPVPTCSEARLDKAVDDRVAPLLRSLKKVRASQDWYLPEYVNPLHELFREKSAAAMEARVALFAYYVGEAYGTELMCAISEDGPAALALIKEYQKCRPITSADPVPEPMLASAERYSEIAAMIENGESCDLHH